MAKTYFEYADRLPESQINWFQVGKDITDAIKKEDELRQKRKAETEAAFRKDINELANAPQGNSDLVNKWTTNYSSKATDYLLQINKLLKAGAIKPKDYTLINQNLRDGTGILFNLSKEYQAEYEEKMKRAQPNGEGSASEVQIMGMIEGFGNLKDTEAVINPLDGSISVGKLVTNKDGVRVLAEGADNLMTVNQLRNRIKQKINKYKVNEDLKGEADLMGDVVNEVISATGSATETGFMTKITDPTKRVGLTEEGKKAVNSYLETEKNIINSKLTNPYNTSSILFDWAGGVDPKTGKPYQVVFDDKIAATSSHYVLYSMKDGMLQPDFDTTANGQEQKKEAEKYLTNKFRSMLEQKTELQPFSQPRKEPAQQWQWEAGQQAKQEKDALALWQELYTAKTTVGKSAAKSALLGTPNAMAQGLLDIDMNDKTIKFIYADPVKNMEVPIVDKFGKPVSGDQFAGIGSSVHGVTERSKYMKFAKDKFATEGIDWKNIGKGRAGTPPEVAAKPQVLGAITSQIGDDLFTMRSQKAAPTLASILAPIPGIIVTDVGGNFGNDVKIEAAGLPPFIFNANLKKEEIADAKDKLFKYIRGTVSEKTAKEILKEFSGGGAPR